MEINLRLICDCSKDSLNITDPARFDIIDDGFTLIDNPNSTC